MSSADEPLWNTDGSRVTISFWSKFRHAVRKFFSAEVRAMTPTEWELSQKLEDARSELARTKALVDSLRTEVGQISSSLRIANTEVEKLAEVVERDRRRVEAETAGWARKIADSTG